MAIATPIITSIDDPRLLHTSPYPPILKVVYHNNPNDTQVALYVNDMPCVPNVWYILDEAYPNATRVVQSALS